jgi:transcriptional regulator with XRE-family HTH domain
MAREDAALDQGQLADLTGIGRNTISNYESGATTKLKSSYLRLIAMATGVDFAWLETGMPDPSDDTPGPGTALPHVDSNHEPFDYGSGYWLAEAA